jgi:hypothetical protein
MRAIIERPPAEGDPVPPLRVRLAWFVGLSVTGCVTTAAVAYLLKALLR